MHALTRGAVVVGFVLASFLTSTGCMTVTLYEPHRAIHRPVVLEPGPNNFVGLRILVRCQSHDDHMPSSDAAKMCGKISEQFENQGATSEWVAPAGANYIEPIVFEGQLPDLTVEIESKIDHAYDYPLSTVASCLSLTIVPGVSEQTFSQRVVVYGRDRSVLTEEVFRERFVEYHGCGVWSANYLIDWIFRTKEDALSGEAGKKAFSKDFYGQIRQLTFNARIRSEVLGLTRAPTRRPVVTAPPSVPATEGSTSSTTAEPVGDSGETVGGVVGGEVGGEVGGIVGGTEGGAPSSSADASPSPTGTTAPDALDDDAPVDPAEE